MIAQAAEREIDRWPLHEPFALAPAMQAITLDVIMSGVFGIEGVPPQGTPERELREEIKEAVAIDQAPARAADRTAQHQPDRADRPGQALRRRARPATYAMIAARRVAGDAEQRTDILSLLLAARDEDGQAMSDQELRDEMLTLVLAGHETTANSLAWAFERLLRTPHAYERLREEVRGDERAEVGADYVEATIHETMRSRPVVPIIGRRVRASWQLGECGCPLTPRCS